MAQGTLGASDLFAARRSDVMASVAPLAERMRPVSLDEVVGLPSLLEPGAAFRMLVESARPVSMVLWGPPGSGKTTLARLVASHCSAVFETLSATSAGVKQVREVLASARRRLEGEGARTVLFLDEIHRFSKNQQDALLPGVENGTLVLIGATTENPFFEINTPLMSRLVLFRTRPLPDDALAVLVERALSDPQRGLSGQPGLENLKITDSALAALVNRSGGDARGLFNILEVAAGLAREQESDRIGTEQISKASGRRIVRYDKGGDRHYDVISAFIKSVRGSDPDAALYWLFLMLEGGEDPEFIARRLLILASEDIGPADRWALPTAAAAASALSYVGMPEAAHHLAHATLFLATAPKSNSVTSAMARAVEAVRNGPSPSVPTHLRGTGYGGADRIGHGEGYVYPHDHADGHPSHVVPQAYFPPEVNPQVFYRPSRNGFETEIGRRLAEIDRVLERKGRGRK